MTQLPPTPVPLLYNASFVLNMIKIRTRKIVSVDFLASKLVAELNTSHIFATWNLSKLDKVR